VRLCVATCASDVSPLGCLAAMRDVATALIAVLYPLSYVIILLATCILIFAIVGMGMYGGKMHACSNPVADNPFGKAHCAGIYVVGAVEAKAAYQQGLTPPETVHVGYLVANTWAPPRYNFDSVSDSMVSLNIPCLPSPLKRPGSASCLLLPPAA
jgi:hypothetical protein